MNDPVFETAAEQEHFDSLNPALKLDRRGFVKTTLATGFAAAVLPVQAQTVVHTDATGLVTGEVRIPVKDGELVAYRAMPAGKTGLPVVLVVHEIFGVHEHIKDIVRRVAKLGYLAIAPDLFARQGDASKPADIGTLMKDIVAKAPDAQVLADLDATAAWAAKNGGGGKLGITGFCWGGRIVLMYAAHNPSLAAAVAWYGPLSRPVFAGDKSALDVAAQIKPAVLGLYGGADQGIPPEAVQKLREALAAGGNTRSEIVVFADTPHGFHADYRASYRKEQADDGWKRLTAWFKQHLG